MTANSFETNSKYNKDENTIIYLENKKQCTILIPVWCLPAYLEYCNISFFVQVVHIQENIDISKKICFGFYIYLYRDAANIS